jgi:hypothetical protein
METPVTDLALPSRRDKPTRDPHRSSLTTPVSGTLRAAESADGANCVFTGTYRLERLVKQYGQTAAVGVFAGKLTTGAGGLHLGMGSRRHTAAAEVSSTPDVFRVDIGPVDIVILGHDVTVEAFSLTIPRHLSAPLGQREGTS